VHIVVNVTVVNQAELHFPLIIMENIGTTHFIVGHYFLTFDHYMTF
jgi:ATP sulfurylase